MFSITRINFQSIHFTNHSIYTATDIQQQPTSFFKMSMTQGALHVHKILQTFVPIAYHVNLTKHLFVVNPMRCLFRDELLQNLMYNIVSFYFVFAIGRVALLCLHWESATGQTAEQFGVSLIRVCFTTASVIAFRLTAGHIHLHVTAK